ncbi:MAG: hypothetical protein NZ455_10045 [Bacteroidia bacterium]|nr:hypothetical protein [Bacteroidia bacterium]MDW8348275.1 hypothetical protein [Bacteroidia bacterium]
MGVSLRCASGRRATGCAIASVLRTAHAPSACLTHAASTLIPLNQKFIL